jgi:hypothetical protein
MWKLPNPPRTTLAIELPLVAAPPPVLRPAVLLPELLLPQLPLLQLPLLHDLPPQ